jgi:hypothetical protein
MTRIILILFLIAAIPWAVATWWEMRRSAGPKERAWVGRASVGGWMLSLLGTIAFVMMGMRGQFLAMPLIVVAALGVRYGMRKTRARIRAEEGDPLSRAKRLN